jgi:hypothetical protein
MKCVEFSFIIVGILGASSFVSTVNAQTLNSAQHQAATRAIKDFKRLVSAVEIGPSFQQYSSLLINAKADIEESLPNIPAGAVSQSLRAALATFIDAHELWRLAIGNSYAYQYVIAACPIFQKYKLDIHKLSYTGCYDVHALFEAIPNRAYTHYMSDRILTPQLQKIWTIGIYHVIDAQKALAR